MLNTLALLLAASTIEPPAAKPLPKLVVVTPAALAESLQDYVGERTKTHAVTLLLLSVALEGPGRDDAEKLKRWLYSDWTKAGKPADYSVLLVGDADVLPVRYMVLDRVTEPAFDYAFYPSDLYYADLARDDGAFDDWNGATEGFHAGYFGEVRGEKNKNDPMNYDKVSYTPEVAVGRWPVSTPEATAAVAKKTIAYGKAVAEAKSKPKAAAVMVGGWIDARPTLDAHAKAIESRFDVTRLFYHDGDNTPALWKSLAEPTAPAITKLLAGTDPVRLVLHAGHGADTAWDQCISVNDIAAMKDAAYPAVIFSAGCSTARFATLPPYEAYEDFRGVEHKGTNAGEVFKEPPPPPAVYAKGPHNFTGLGEELLRAPTGGAVAYIGCNTGSQPAALTLMAGFVDGIATPTTPASPTLTVGGCWKHAVAEYVKRENLMQLKPSEDWYPASIFFQGMKFMLFGDPTAPI